MYGESVANVQKVQKCVKESLPRMAYAHYRNRHRAYHSIFLEIPSSVSYLLETRNVLTPILADYAIGPNFSFDLEKLVNFLHSHLVQFGSTH